MVFPDEVSSPASTLFFNAGLQTVESHLHSPCMRIEMLSPSHQLHSRTYRLHSLGRDMLESELTAETVKVYTVVSPCITMSGQSVISTAGIVASALAGVVPEEYTSGIDHSQSKLLTVFCGQYEVLGCVDITQSNSLVDIFHQDKVRTLKCFSSYLAPWQLLQLRNDLLFYFLQFFL